MGELFKKMTNSIITSADRGLTMADLILEMAGHLKEDDPERIFTEWFITNQGRMLEACAELNIEHPAEGPDLFKRLKAAALPALMERQKE